LPKFLPDGTRETSILPYSDTADILKQRDPRHPNEFLVDYVLDTAQQKGTGKWTSINALDLGIPANSIAEAVFARCLSVLKPERVEASSRLRGPEYTHGRNRDELMDAVRDRLHLRN
jgi:6-phosphogluconate dehydrogenase